MTNILVLDNSEILRAGIASLLESLTGVAIFHGTEEWEIAGWYAEKSADIVILDAIDATRANVQGRLQHIRRKFHNAVVILLTGTDSFSAGLPAYDADYVLSSKKDYHKLQSLVRDVSTKQLQDASK